MSKIHIWIGHTDQSEEEFAQYFELDYSKEGDFDDPDYRQCGFCKDTGTQWYDEDFFGLIFASAPLTVQELLEETPVDHPEAYEAALQRCSSLGLSNGNVVFYLTDSELEVQDRNKLYNGLHYLGMYDSELI